MLIFGNYRICGTFILSFAMFNIFLLSLLLFYGSTSLNYQTFGQEVRTISFSSGSTTILGGVNPPQSDTNPSMTSSSPNLSSFENIKDLKETTINYTTT